MNGSSILNEFQGRGQEDEQSISQLIKESGKYYIKRDCVTLLLYSEADKAVKGFDILRKRRLNE